MESHKNWGITTLFFMIITCFSAFCKPIKKSHAFWGGLTLFCLIGALASGLRKGGRKDTADTE